MQTISAQDTMDSQDGDLTVPRAKGRLMADPSITVSDLMEPLAAFMTEHGTRDEAKHATEEELSEANAPSEPSEKDPEIP